MYKRLATIMTSFVAVERGSPYTEQYRVFFKKADKVISPWHDVPLYADEKKHHFNMLCEIPRWTNAKMEIATKELLNPIKQDIKKGKVRFVDNCFPHHGYIWNYGALPQTWEDPNHIDPATNAKGDNDPIDVCEIGYQVAKRGDIYPVKVIGVIALIDEGETDWKLIAINVNDPLADKLNDITDVEQHMPGFLAATREWFRIYKIPAGKPENQFAFGGEFKDKAFAHKIIQETHEFWKKLVARGSDGEINCNSVECSQAAKRISYEDAERVLASAPMPAPPAHIDEKVDQWHYVKG